MLKTSTLYLTNLLAPKFNFFWNETEISFFLKKIVPFEKRLRKFSNIKSPSKIGVGFLASLVMTLRQKFITAEMWSGAKEPIHW